MEQGVRIFWGGKPLEESENDFLTQLKADLEYLNVSAIILANFYTHKASRQVDFFVVTDSHACHVELKNYQGILVGGPNGSWSVQQEDGTLTAIERTNPYQQVETTRFPISYDMGVFAANHSSASRQVDRDFYKEFDSVVCIFPELMDGSQVPNDYKVKTMGYGDFVQFIATAGKRPRWQPSVWLDFIDYYNLVDSRALPKDIALVSAEKIINDYTSRFKDFYMQELQGIVAQDIHHMGLVLSSLDISSLFKESRSVQLIGRSGAGKTHIALHSALKMIDNNGIPFFIHANMYGGKTSLLLTKSAAPFSTRSTTDLFKLAALTQRQITLIIDGYNECPPRLREMLLQDLSALCLNQPVKLLITSQEPIKLTEFLKGSIVKIPQLNSREREEILSLYQAPKTASYYEAFLTPYELSLAAACANELGRLMTRADLFSTYIRKQLIDCSSPTLARAILREIALYMDKEITTMIPSSEAWRLAEKIVRDNPKYIGVADEAINSTLLSTIQGKMMFSHELIGRFLVAESIIGSYPETDGLVKELNRPRHDDLREFVVSLKTENISEALAELNDLQIVTDALGGVLGLSLKKKVEEDLNVAFQQTIDSISKASVVIQSLHECLFSDDFKFTSYQKTLLSASGNLLAKGILSKGVIELLRASDEMCNSRASGPNGEIVSVGETVSSVYIGFINKGTSPGALILGAFERGRFNYGSAVRDSLTVKQLESIISQATPQSYGILIFLSYALRQSRSPEMAEYIPQLLRLAWNSKTYHVRLQALWAAQSFCAVAEGESLKRIKELLPELSTGNIMLSSTLVEVMDAYDLIEPLVSIDQVSEDIKRLLAGSRNENAYKIANGIFSNQFEEIFSEAHTEAIDRLSDGDKVEFLTMASLGSHYGSFVNWILAELFTLKSRSALPAFKYWATNFNVNTSHPQDAISAFCIGIKGYSTFFDNPPVVNFKSEHQFLDKKIDKLDSDAWQAYAEIIFWVHHPGITEVELKQVCEPLWTKLRGELVTASIDPLYRFSWASVFSKHTDDDTHHMLLVKFPDQVRMLTRAYLQSDKEATTIMIHPDSEQETRRYAIDLLGLLGDVDDVDLLMNYSDSDSFGSSAVKAIKKINTGDLLI